MSIRILGGQCKGTRLQVPRQSSLRPTSVLLRRRVFDCYQDLSHCHFIDCCAGVGGMGLEAWSRGAAEVILVEENPTTFAFLQKNVLKFQEMFPEDFETRKIRPLKGKIEKWWSSVVCSLPPQGSVIFFLDPPYKLKHVYEFVLAKLKGVQGLEVHLWIESSSQEGLSQKDVLEWGIPCEKFFVQGKNFIGILRF